MDRESFGRRLQSISSVSFLLFRFGHKKSSQIGLQCRPLCFRGGPDTLKQGNDEICSFYTKIRKSSTTTTETQGLVFIFVRDQKTGCERS